MQLDIQTKVQDHYSVHMYICFIKFEHNKSDKFHDHFRVYIYFIII